MNEETIGIGKNEYLFQHLVAMFQTLALQQLGKLINPINGKLERDLHQARITIDMLQMLQVKTAGNLDDNEKRLLDTVVMELQLNYIDEMERAEKPGTEEEEKEKITEEETGDSAEAETSTEEAKASGAGEQVESGGKEEQPEKASPKKKKTAKSRGKKKT